LWGRQRPEDGREERDRGRKGSKGNCVDKQKEMATIYPFWTKESKVY